MTRGIIYLAKGEDYIDNACRSAQQVKSVMPDIPISIVSDREIDRECFDDVIVNSSTFEKRDKPWALQQTPYERTIYIDADTFLYSDISEIYDILDEFEIALVRDHLESNIQGPHPGSAESHPIDGVPEGFPEFNSGLIAYRDNETVMRFLRSWRENCQPDHEYDQRSLRPTLYFSDVQFTPLPPRYNCLYSFNGFVSGEVKLFHIGESNREQISVNLESAIDKLNHTDVPRVYQTYEDTLLVNYSPDPVRKFLITLRHRGLRETIFRTKNKIVDNI